MTDASPLLDAADLMAQLDNDLDLLREILGIFLDQSEELLTGLDAAWARGDQEELIRTAHTLKGSLLQIGAGAAAPFAEHIELLGRDGMFSSVPDASATLHSVMKRVEREVRDHLARS